MFLIKLLCAIGIGACGAGGNGGGDNAPGPADPDPPQTEQPPAAGPHVDDLRERVVVSYPIGRSNNKRAIRQVRDEVADHGWRHFVNQVVLPQMSSRGLQRLELHNPFGTQPSWVEPMQFDQYRDARQAGLDWLTQDFAAAWQPVLDQGIEVIAYVGSPILDDEAQQFIAANGYEAFLHEYALPVLAPILDAGMSVGLDAAAKAGPDSATYKLAEHLRSQGHTVYIEANPRAADQHWHDYPVMVRDDTWRERQRDNPARWADRSALTAGVIKFARIPIGWVRGHANDAWPAKVCRVLAEGDGVTVTDRILRSDQRTLRGLSDCVAGQ